MNKQDLIQQILIFINDNFYNNIPNYTFKSIKNCYNNSIIDINSIGISIISLLNINIDNLDIITNPTNDYFIFNYKNSYIIINFNLDIFYNCEFKVIIVKTRNEALTYRYGD